MKRLIVFLFSGILLTAFAEEKHELSVSIQTPHPGYGLQVQRVDNGGEHTFVLAKVIPAEPDRMYPMVISQATDTVSVSAPLKTVKLYLLGRTWSWGDDPTVDSAEKYLKKIGKTTSVPFERTAGEQDEE